MWSYEFYVFPSQDRATRFADATVSNPSIAPTDQTDVELARDLAFGYVDEVSMEKPFKVSASGGRADDGSLYNFQVSVNKEA